VNEGVSRSPVFVFDKLLDAGKFVLWVTEQFEAIRREAESTTSHGKLLDVGITMESNHVYLLLEFHTGDAAGQNMVTLAADAVCRYIEANSPIKPKAWFVEGNMSGDKKASALAMQTVRGKKVIAEVVLPAKLIERKLRTSARRMEEYYQASSLGGVLSGNLGIQGHYANGLAAIFIACGQDAACVAESALGITRIVERDGGDLYVSVTLPNMIVGTVGGGTALPSQKACLEILGLAGTGHANAFAEVCGALVLAGEVSIIAALSCGEFARAHHKLARGKTP
jgi:hydroxymethylglutaryl-CoA reductase (NADPH)